MNPNANATNSNNCLKSTPKNNECRHLHHLTPRSPPQDSRGTVKPRASKETPEIHQCKRTAKRNWFRRTLNPGTGPRRQKKSLNRDKAPRNSQPAERTSHISARGEMPQKPKAWRRHRGEERQKTAREHEAAARDHSAATAMRPQLDKYGILFAGGRVRCPGSRFTVL